MLVEREHGRVTPQRRARSSAAASRAHRGERVSDPLPSGQPPLGNKRLKGRYKLGAALGHGSLGVTYRAEDTLLQRPVAIKMLADRYADDPVFRERFMAATAAAGRLIHPHIVTVLDAGVVDGHPFVVMELVEGHSLRARLNERGPLPIADSQRIALQLAEGLALAHRQGVIHGDIRPENVLLDEHGNAKLTDFGFVRAAVATDVTLLGTVQRAAYSPPELPIRERGDGPTDVYALAVVVYEMLCGATPRAAGSHDRGGVATPIPVRRRRPDGAGPARPGALEGAGAGAARAHQHGRGPPCRAQRPGFAVAAPTVRAAADAGRLALRAAPAPAPGLAERAMVTILPLLARRPWWRRRSAGSCSSSRASSTASG